MPPTALAPTEDDAIHEEEKEAEGGPGGDEKRSARIRRGDEINLTTASAQTAAETAAGRPRRPVNLERRRASETARAVPAHALA